MWQLAMNFNQNATTKHLLINLYWTSIVNTTAYTTCEWMLKTYTLIHIWVILNISVLPPEGKIPRIFFHSNILSYCHLLSLIMNQFSLSVFERSFWSVLSLLIRIIAHIPLWTNYQKSNPDLYTSMLVFIFITLRF